MDNGLLHAVKLAVYIQQAIIIRRRNLIFTNSNGETFALSQFAVVNEGLGESVLQRIDRLGSIQLMPMLLEGRQVPLQTRSTQRPRISNCPKRITVEYLGYVKNHKEVFASLDLALIIWILLVYLIMVTLYESLIYPFVVLFSIPIALIGALPALALAMETLIFSGSSA